MCVWALRWVVVGWAGVSLLDVDWLDGTAQCYKKENRHRHKITRRIVAANPPALQVVCKPGGTIDDSEMIEGLVLDHKAGGWVHRYIGKSRAVSATSANRAAATGCFTPACCQCSRLPPLSLTLSFALLATHCSPPCSHHSLLSSLFPPLLTLLPPFVPPSPPSFAYIPPSFPPSLPALLLILSPSSLSPPFPRSFPPSLPSSLTSLALCLLPPLTTGALQPALPAAPLAWRAPR